MNKTDKLLSLYSRKGSKRNHAEQITRIKSLLTHSKTFDPHQIGSRHIVSFYAYLREKQTSDRTMYYYYLSFCVLYKILDRGKPPEPLYSIKKPQQ